MTNTQLFIQGQEEENSTYDQEIPASQVKADRFPFPCEGNITLAVRNKNYALGPVMLDIVMKAGSAIPPHLTIVCLRGVLRR